MTIRFFLKSLFILLIAGIVFSCSTEEEVVVTPPPGSTALSLPANNEACESGQGSSASTATVSFSWSAATNATAYDLSVTNISVPNMSTNAVITKNDLTGTSTTLDLERGQAYSWKVTSKNDSSSTADSATWKFYLAGEAEQNAAPFAASAVNPAPGSTVSPSEGKVTIKWESSDPDKDTLTYALEVSTAKDFTSDKTETFTDLNDSTKEINVSIGVYYWRVTVADESISVTSDVFSFRVE